MTSRCRLVRASHAESVCYRFTQTTKLAAESSKYGEEIIREVAARLTREFGSGFSKTNLEYMRRFYLTYPKRIPQIAQTASEQFPAAAIAQTLSGQLEGTSGQSQPTFSLSWSHYVFLIGLKEQERNFYEIEAAQQGWTLRALRRQFDAGLYERLALSRDKQAIRDLARKGPQVATPQDLLKGLLSARPMLAGSVSGITTVACMIASHARRAYLSLLPLLAWTA